MTKHLAELKKAFLKRGYQKTSIYFQFNQLNDRQENIKTKNKEESIQAALVQTCNQTLPNFKVIQDHQFRKYHTFVLLNVHNMRKKQPSSGKFRLHKHFLYDKQPVEYAILPISVFSFLQH